MLRRHAVGVTWAACLVLGSSIGNAPVARASTTPAFAHMFVLVMENHSYGEIVGSSAAPYVNSLLPTSGVASDYFAVAHPSLPNYLALTAGSTFGITSDCTTCWVGASNIADSLESAGKTWKAYEESMPSPCFVGDSYPYVQKHDPFIYFNDVRGNPSRCQSHVVPYSHLAGDLSSTATTPNYAFITPNICNDMHDCSVATGDAWLKQQVPQILASPAFTTQSSLLAIVWDEDDSSGTNQVPAILLGSAVSAGLQSTLSYNHYSLLRTIETGLGLPALTGTDGSAATMDDFFGLAGWSSLGGIATSAAAASSSGSVRNDVFVRGTDESLWQRTSTSGAWGSWQSLGGIVTSNPAAVASTTGRIDVFVRGTDSGLWQRTFDGTSWSNWVSLGGILTSAPAASSFDVFVRGTDNALWHRKWTGSQWSNWEDLGGILTSDPASVPSGTNGVDVFGRGTDNGLWRRSWNGSTWGNWTPLGGLLMSGPAAASCASGHMDVVVVGSDMALYHLGFGGAWSNWQRLGGYWTTNPGAVCPAGGSTVDLFERAPNLSVVETTTPAS